VNSDRKLRVRLTWGSYNSCAVRAAGLYCQARGARSQTSQASGALPLTVRASCQASPPSRCQLKTATGSREPRGRFGRGRRDKAHRADELDAAAASSVQSRPLSKSALWRAATRDCSRLTEPNAIARIFVHLKARQDHERDARAPPVWFVCRRHRSRLLTPRPLHAGGYFGSPAQMPCVNSGTSMLASSKLGYAADRLGV
jgi:hypothetical protein